MNPGLCLILRICFDSFWSGRAKSRCGGVLAIVFSEFYCQHFFGFHTFRTIIYQFSLTLTSSISFCDYLISGTKHTKLSQNGRYPRPAGRPRPGRSAYPYGISSCNSSEMLLNTISSKDQVLDTGTIN